MKKPYVSPYQQCSLFLRSEWANVLFLVSKTSTPILHYSSIPVLLQFAYAMLTKLDSISQKERRPGGYSKSMERTLLV